MIQALSNHDTFAEILVRFSTEFTIGYTTTITMVFTTVAGNTTPAIRAIKPPGKPTISAADVKKIMPDTSVPTAVRTAATGVFTVVMLRTRSNKPKMIKAVIGLSMIFGTCPPGNPVVKAEIAPVVNPSSKTFLTPGNSKIPKNIMVNIMSGFIPNKTGGIIACSTAPIPTNKDSDTNVFVFISHLSSSKLSSKYTNNALVPIAYIYRLIIT